MGVGGVEREEGLPPGNTVPWKNQRQLTPFPALLHAGSETVANYLSSLSLHSPIQRVKISGSCKIKPYSICKVNRERNTE